MPAIANINGRIYGERDAVVSVFDHGFLFGEGVYEVMRTYRGRPFLFDQHLKRMRASAERISLTLPMSDSEVARSIADSIAAYQAGPGTGEPPTEYYIRMLVTRGIGDMTYNPSSSLAPTIVIIVKPLGPTPAEVYEQGVKVALVSVVRNHPSSLDPHIKSNNLLNSALAMQEAMRKGAFESLMRNHRGEIAECAQSNIFIIRNGRLITPPLSAGILPGITREFVLGLAPSVGVPAEEQTLRDADLFAADEAFLSVTTREIVPVVSVDDHTIGDGKPGALTRRLRAELQRRALELSR